MDLEERIRIDQPTDVARHVEGLSFDSGTKARRSTLPGLTLGAEGGSCRQFCGRYDRYRFTPISASDSP